MTAWLALVAAPFVGSFLGVLARRLPVGGTVVWGRSACEACDAPLRPWELVPIASFLLQRGRCRRCGAEIARAHLAIELAAVAIAAWALTVDSDPVLVWGDCALGWTLLTLAWIDAGHMVLPDALTLPLLVAGLGFTAWVAPDAIGGSAAGAAAGYAGLRAVAAAYKLARGRDGLGQGDAKLLAASGAWVGLAALPFVLLAASLAGLAAALAMRAAGRSVGRTTAIPFGPFLAAGTWLVWLYGAG